MNGVSWTNIASFAGVPTKFSPLLARSVVWDGLRLLILGSVIETARRAFIWVIDRSRLRWSTTAEFEVGDVTQEWIINYLIQEKVWRTPRNIFVKPKNNKRKWRLQTSDKYDQVDFIPEYGFVQFFRWRGYFFEVSSQKDKPRHPSPYARRFDSRHSESPAHANSISLTIFTLDRSVLYAFVEECRLKYADHTKFEVTVYTASVGRNPYLGGGSGWNDVKMMRRRQLDSLLLDENVIDSLLKDAREFLEVEDWYISAGIPHRRGYLLYGPPGTGKTSTIYTIAGELGLEIYALSLSSKSLDDASLAHLVSLLPPRGVLVLEDIDCAFPSRVDGDEDEFKAKQLLPFNVSRTSQVTMSGLLNILDGVGSEEGKIFFATTNHIDRLDPALVRPGRIDRKIEYRLASPQQARGLFLRFFPDSTASKLPETLGEHSDAKGHDMQQLADRFAGDIPSYEFSMAELQGYLLDHRADPLEALSGVQRWVDDERQERRDKEAREQLQKDQKAQAQEQRLAIFPGVPTAMPPLPTPVPSYPGYGQYQTPTQCPPNANPDHNSLGNSTDSSALRNTTNEAGENPARKDSDDSQALDIPGDMPPSQDTLSSLPIAEIKTCNCGLPICPCLLL